MYLIKSASLLFNHYILPIEYMIIINLPGTLSSALESDLAHYQQAGLAVRAIAADCNVGWVPQPERRNGPICIAASTSSKSQQLLNLVAKQASSPPWRAPLCPAPLAAARLLPMLSLL